MHRFKVVGLAAALVLLALQFPVASARADPLPPGWLCRTPMEKVTTVGTSAVPCPATALQGRLFVVLCNSNENSGTPLVKVRIDNVTPVMGTTHAGLVLSKGVCQIYYLPSSATPMCISDTASTAVTSVECK